MPKLVAVGVLVFFFWVPTLALIDKIRHTAYVSRVAVALTGQYTGFLDAFLDMNSSLIGIALGVIFFMIVYILAPLGVILFSILSLFS